MGEQSLGNPGGIHSAVVLGRQIDDDVSGAPDEGLVSSSDSASEHESPSAAEALEQKLADYMCNMRATSSDILRATWAFRALGGCGGALRGRTGLHYQSFTTTRVRDFWSHSWHGGKWKKFLTVMFLQNGMIAVFIATFGSFVTMILVSVGILSGYRAPDKIVLPGVNWCSCCGLVLYCLTLFFWRRRYSIFLDIICIDQQDNDRKTMGIISMGAILKASDSMLVLWDPSYTGRLWCVWELAAFLRSRANEQPNVTIKPTSAGAAYLVQSLACAVGVAIVSSIPDGGPESRAPATYIMAIIVACCGYAVVTMCRAYFRSIDVLCKELESFTTDNATCYCCTSGHENGICDRKVLLKCISVWFGNVEAFEQTVRTRVLNILANNLWYEPFSYKQCLAATSPILWLFFNAIAGDLHYRDNTFEQHSHNVLLHTFRGLGWWLGCFPAMFFTLLLLSRFLRKDRGMLEVPTNFLVLLVVVGLFMGLHQLEYVVWFIVGMFEWKALWRGFIFFTPFVTMLSWCCFGCFHRWRNDVPQQDSGPLFHTALRVAHDDSRRGVV